MAGEYSSTYSDLQDALEKAGAQCSASESHGLLCGIVCGAGKADRTLWLEPVLGEGNTLSSAAQAAQGVLQALYAEIQSQLNDPGLGLELLLPGDDVLLAVRSTALGDWCRGFLYGLAVGGVREDPEPGGHVSELMRDFFEISRAQPEEVSSEEEEDAYMEITEYVRMCVLLCHAELQPLPAPERLQ